MLCIVILFSATATQAEREDGHKNNLAAETLLDTISRKLESLESDKGSNDKPTEELKTLYRSAIASLESAASNDEITANYIRTYEEASAQTSEFRQKIEQIQNRPVESAILEFENLNLEELELLLVKEKADRAAVDANLSKYQETLKYHKERPQAIRQRLIEANAEANGMASELRQPIVAGESQIMREAKHWVGQALAIYLDSEIKMLDEELLSHVRRTDLINTQIEYTQASTGYVTERLEQLEARINDKRNANASQVQMETERSKQATAGQHRLLQQLANSNTELSQKISEYTLDLKQLEKEVQLIDQKAGQINQDHAKAQQKLDIVGMSKILGQVLQEQRRALPDTRVYRKKVEQLEKQIADVSLQQLEYKDESEKLRDLDTYVASYMLEAGVEYMPQLKGSVRDLLIDRGNYLSQLISVQNAYLRALSELDFSQTRLVNVATDYDDYLAENLLWIRNTPSISLHEFSVIPSQIRTLLSPTRWKAVMVSLWQQAGSSPAIFLILSVSALLLWKRPYMLMALKSTGNAVGKPSKDSILFTLQGLMWTFLLALVWPLLMAGMGWQLQNAITAEPYSKAVSQALLQIAEGLLILRMAELLFARIGVAARHFKWSVAGLNLLRRDIRILMFTFLPLGFVAIVVLNSDISGQGAGLGRIIFVLMMLALTLFFFRVLNPASGVLPLLLTGGRMTTIIGVRYTWLILAILLPILAALLAIAGYLYTAGTLVDNFVSTMWLLLALICIHQFVVRWLLVIRGRLTLQATREKRETERQAALSRQEDSDKPIDSIADLEEQAVDINGLSEDSLSLLNMTIVILAALGAWVIWSDILPALGVFNQITLYQNSIEVGGEPVLKSITLADFGQTILIVFVLIILVRRLPAFLEILLRQRKSISTGSIYAIKSLATYALIGVGVMLVFSQLGGVWSDFQWIIAALGVGIGFGLQEIVANFISGLIILFERPIRVGDVVTVGDISGTVTRIQIRATTIRDWDRKELLVPNKEFITSRVLNWSLSDTVTRLTSTIGVAYGSDVALAIRLIEEAARENDMLLDTPPPDVAFTAFGDNSLNLSARVYINNIDYRVRALSELHRTINEKFNEAGVVIAFPQRDLHLNTTRPLDIRIKP